MLLYTHQKKWVNECLQAMAEHQKVLGQSPTGSGKTVMFNNIIWRCVKKGYRTLVLAHRKELILQARQRLWEMHQIPAGIIMGNNPTRYDLPVQIASVQTIKNRKMPPNIKVLITDEAHHAKASTYQYIYDQYPDAKTLGVTATPWRLSGAGFTDTYNKMVTGPTIKELEHSKYLVPAFQRVVPMNRSSFEKLVKVSSTGDYNLKDLNIFMSSDTMVDATVASWLVYGEGKKTIIFASGIEQASKIVDRLRSHGVTAVLISNKTPKDHRASYLEGFRSGRFKVAVNVGILTEGVDVPSVECVLLARPTRSLALYLQMCGRGSRPAKGKKYYILIDIADCIIEHGEPNKDWHWSLEGRNKDYDDLERTFLVTDPDGLKQELSASKIPSTPGLMLEEVQRSVRLIIFDRALERVKYFNKKDSSAFYYFRDKIKEPPTRPELEYICAALGYKNSWIDYQLKRQK